MLTPFSLSGGWNTGLLYNVFGEWLSQVGVGVLPRDFLSYGS